MSVNVRYSRRRAVTLIANYMPHKNKKKKRAAREEARARSEDINELARGDAIEPFVLCVPGRLHSQFGLLYTCLCARQNHAIGEGDDR